MFKALGILLVFSKRFFFKIFKFVLNSTYLKRRWQDGPLEVTINKKQQNLRLYVIYYV